MPTITPFFGVPYNPNNPSDKTNPNANPRSTPVSNQPKPTHTNETHTNETHTNETDINDPLPTTKTDDHHVVYDADTSRFLLDGETLTLTELLFKIGGEAAIRAKETLAVAVESLNDANKDGKAAVEWLNKLRNLTPEGGAGSTVSTNKINQARDAFKAKYGFDPMDKYQASDFKRGNGETYTQTEMDKMTEANKSYVSTVNNNQQAVQLDIERYTHVVTEADQMVASVDKAINETLTSIENKIG